MLGRCGPVRIQPYRSPALKTPVRAVPPGTEWPAAAQICNSRALSAGPRSAWGGQSAEAAERIRTAGIRERMVCFGFGIQGEDVRRKITIQETTAGNNENRTAD